MSSNRVVIGQRTNGDLGIFVGPAGLDALTALDSDLLLNVSSKVSQLVLSGFVSFNATVALGFSRSPFVMITSQVTISGIGPGYDGLNGPLRPSPGQFFTGTSGERSAVTINGNGTSMTFNITYRTSYQVYNSPFT